MAARIVSRRAQQMLRSSQPGASKRKPPKADDTPWPQSIRYAFYTVCVASVPFTIGQAVAMSPRLRESMSGDAESEEFDDDGHQSTATRIISLVRKYWGHHDYLAPVDSPKLPHTIPGHRNSWEEDNYTALLHLLGLDNSDSAPQEEHHDVPMSLDNEPPYSVRKDQANLQEFLATKSNPDGVKVKLSLVPLDNDGGFETSAGYETECTLPASLSMNALREICQGSDAQSLRSELAATDPSFHFVSTSERIRTTSWNKNCRWIVSFPTDDEDGDNTFSTDVAAITLHGGGSNKSEELSRSEIASKGLRHNTSIHSAWTHFSEASMSSSAVASSMGTTTNIGEADSPPVLNTSVQSSSTTADALRMEALKHTISSLEAELKDPNSLRDRDGMYEEMRAAKSELRKLRPWWRRLV